MTVGCQCCRTELDTYHSAALPVHSVLQVEVVGGARVIQVSKETLPHPQGTETAGPLSGHTGNGLTLDAISTSLQGYPTNFCTGS